LANKLSQIIDLHIKIFVLDKKRKISNLGLLNKYEQKALTQLLLTDKLSQKIDGELNWDFFVIKVEDNIIGALGVLKDIKYGKYDKRTMEITTNHIANVLKKLDLEHQLEQRKISNEKEKIRSLLLSSISHDLKTPLSVIIGSLNIYKTLSKTLSQEETKYLIDSTIEEAERLENFIKKILKMAKIESGAIKLHQSWYNPLDVVYRVRRIFMKSNDKINIVINKNFKPNIELYIDYVLIEQVIQNLLENAIKYSYPNKDIVININLEKKSTIFEIKNEGIKIPKNKLARIFDRYLRLEDQDKKVPGTGLGLTICKTFIEMHNGKIKVQSTNDGTMVIFSLPTYRIIQ
jgi:two-component system sensor histidine kinase KdpD